MRFLRRVISETCAGFALLLFIFLLRQVLKDLRTLPKSGRNS